MVSNSLLHYMRDPRLMEGNSCVRWSRRCDVCYGSHPPSAETEPSWRPENMRGACFFSFDKVVETT